MTETAHDTDRFRRLVEGAPDALVAIDRLGRVVFASGTVTGLTGWAPAELVGRDPISLVHPGDVERVRRGVAEVLATPGLPRTVELRCRRRDGEHRDLEAAVVNRLNVPGLAVVVLSLRDVTERKRAESTLRESEEQLRQLAENLDAAFWIREVDPPRLAYVSPGFARIFDVTAREVLLDPFAWLERVHPDDRPGLREAVLAQGKGGYDREYRIVHADGSTRWIRSRAFAIPGEPGSVRRVAGISYDVTERRRAVAELAGQTELVSNVLAVARATTERPTLEGTLQGTLDVLKSVTGAEGASLFLIDEAGTIVESLFSHEHLAPCPAGDEAQRIMTRGLAGWVARNRQPALVGDTARDERWLELPGEAPMRSALCAPIASGTGVVGILTLVHSEPEHFGARHLELLRTAGDQMSLALRNAQFVEALSGMATRERLLHEVLQTATAARGRGELLEVAKRSIAAGTRWRQASLMVPDAPRRERLRRAAGSDDERSLGTPAARRAFADGRVQITRDLREETEGPQGEGSEVAVPLRRGERVLGVLDVRSGAADDFRAEDVRLLESVADTVALAVENAELFESLAGERERLDALIQASRDGVLLAGPDRSVLVINEPAIRLLELGGGVEEWLQRPLDELGASLPPALLRPARLDDRTEEEGTFETDARHVRWRSVPVRTAGGPIGRLVVLYDVTEEERAARLREDLTSTMVHDLRAPLTSILGYVSVALGSKELPQAERSLLVRVESAAERLRALVSGILDISRLESGQMPLDPRPIDVGALAGEVLQLHAPQIREKELRAVRAMGPSPRAVADPELLRRVLQNLVSNAVSFTPARGLVRVAIERDREDPAFLAIRVTDSGSGIPSAIRGRLFQKFASGRGPGSGSGLGLAFCRLAVEAHGGTIDVESTSASGTTFLVRLPVEAAPPSSDVRR